MCNPKTMLGRNDFLARKNGLLPDQCYKLEKIIRASLLTFIINNCYTKKSLLGSDWTSPLKSTLRLPVSPTCKSPELPSGQTPPGPCSRQVNNEEEHTTVNISSSLESEPIESERMAESVVERNAGDHNGFNLPRFAMSLVQLRSHQLDFPERFMLIVDAER